MSYLGKEMPLTAAMKNKILERTPNTTILRIGDMIGSTLEQYF
jgi:hypothetical protein